MAFPTAATDSLAICFYSAEVAGRALGLSEAETFIPDPEQRTVLKGVGEKVLHATKALLALFITRITLENLDNRTAVGKGRAIDRVFDRFNALTSETIRSGVAGGNRDHPAYRKVYDTGSPAPFQEPTIREDPNLSAELAKRLQTLPDTFEQKAGLVANVEKLQALIAPAAAAITSGEESHAGAFKEEVVARQAVIDALWVGKKAAEQSLLRDRSTISFIFFDFRKETKSTEPTGGGPPVPPTS